MRIILIILALSLMVFGFLLINKSYDEPEAAPVSAPHALSSPSQNKANPLVLGLALLSGGVVFLVLVCRRGR